MSNLEILNEMALLDGEQPFVSSDFESESVLMFDSLSDAKSAFEFTNQIKNKLSIQVAEANIPAEWTEMINDFPETATASVSKDMEAPTFISRILLSFGANRGVWGGGFATACLVFLLVNPADKASESGPSINIVSSKGSLIIDTENSRAQAASQISEVDSSPDVEMEALIEELEQLDAEICAEGERQETNTDGQNSAQASICNQDDKK